MTDTLNSLDTNGIRLAILDRLGALESSCNSTHITHNAGVLRGLLWALTGKDPGTLSDGRTVRVLQLAGIPCTEKDGVVTYVTPGDAEWPV